MYFDCERAMKLTIPATRIAVSSLLESTHGLTQSEIASRLGIAQAAVSKYLNHKYSRKLDALISEVHKRGMDAVIADLAVRGATTKEVARKIDACASNPALMALALKPIASIAQR